MPGIVGLITKMPREKAEAQLRQMVQAMCGESFYRTGTWIDENAGLYVGWVAQENSFSDGMPLRNERGDVTMIFSGEEYPELGTPPSSNGTKLTAGRPSSFYLVQRYQEDSSFPLNLNGMFHGLVADRTRGLAILFNDHYGMHRILYHEAADAFYFAAEAKAILAARPELRTPDLQGLGEFVALSCVLEDRTIFKDIRALPAASSWVFREGKIERKTSYFNPKDWENQPALDAESYYQELRKVFSRNLPRYFARGQQVGMTVTGGLDTRVIMAWHKPAPGSLPCYTFGSVYRDNQDVLIGRRVASVCGQSHQVITVGKEFLDHFPYYAERTVQLTEGTVDLYRASDLYVSQKARAIAPAKVVGTYGSEIILHSVMFKPTKSGVVAFQPDFLVNVRQASDTYNSIRRQHPITFAAFRQSPWYHHGILALEQSQLTVHSPYMDRDFVRTVYRAPRTNGVPDDVRIRLIREGSAALASFPTDRGIAGISGRLRSAYDRAYLEFTFKAEYAYDYGMPQWLTRLDHQLSALHLERLFLGRHKLLHFRVWYRDALAKYVKEILLDSRTLSRPYLDRQGVESIVKDHTSGTRNCTTDIHKLLTLELVQRAFFDAK